MGTDQQTTGLPDTGRTSDQAFLTGRQFQAVDGVADWRVLGRTAAAWFAAPSHAAGAALVRRVAELVDALPDPPPGGLPDMDVRDSGVQARLARVEHGFPAGTVDLARAVSAAARDLGLTADPSVVQDVQLTFDAVDRAAAMPFWASVLGYELDGDEDLVDPLRRHPPIWWQDLDPAAPRPLRNRIHLDSVAPQPVAAAALEAVRGLGASSVAEHGYYATVADPEGNEVDILPLPEGADRWDGDSPATEDWRLVFAGTACYPTASTAQAVDLAEAAARLADEVGLPLSIDVRPGMVVLDTGKDRWEMEEGYAVLAARVQEAARALGLTADVALPRFVQVGIDAADIPAVRAFWRAALGYDEDPRSHVTDIVDPRRLSPVLFFQDIDADDGPRRAQRNRIHVDVYVPEDRVRERVDAALAAGGRIVFDRHAPFWWTIADPEGNEVDLSTTPGREEHWG